MSFSYSIYTLQTKKLLCPSKKPAGTPYQYDQIHICFCLWPFLDPSTYIIATIVFLRYWRHWPSFSFIAIWYQMILQVVNTSSQWVENISVGAFLFFLKKSNEYWLFNVTFETQLNGWYAKLFEWWSFREPDSEYYTLSLNESY